jgi:hypothetical protein
MLAMGAVLTGAAVFILGLITPIFRRPDPPRWTRMALVGELITVAIVSAMTLGLGFLAIGIFHTLKGDEPLLDLVIFGALVVASVVFLRWRRARIALAASPAPLGTPANDLAGAAKARPRRRAA